MMSFTGLQTLKWLWQLPQHHHAGLSLSTDMHKFRIMMKIISLFDSRNTICTTSSVTHEKIHEKFLQTAQSRWLQTWRMDRLTSIDLDPNRVMPLQRLAIVCCFIGIEKGSNGEGSWNCSAVGEATHWEDALGRQPTDRLRVSSTFEIGLFWLGEGFSEFAQEVARLTIEEPSRRCNSLWVASWRFWSCQMKPAYRSYAVCPPQLASRWPRTRCSQHSAT